MIFFCSHSEKWMNEMRMKKYRQKIGENSGSNRLKENKVIGVTIREREMGESGDRREREKRNGGE